MLVGLFFDYVRENYTALNQAYDNPQDAFDKIFAEELTASDTDEEDFEDIIEELVDQEVSELAEAREKLIVSDQEASLVAEFARCLNASDLDPAKHFHLRLAAAEYLVARIGSKANPHIYDTVIALVEAARDQEAKPDTKNAETILQRLGTAGFDISDSTTAWVRKHTFTVLAPLIDRVCFLSLAFSEVRKKADQAFKTYTNEVHERLAAGDMSGVQSAAANAQTAGEQVDAAKAQEYTLFNDLPALFEDLNKDPEDLDAFLNGLDTSVIDAFGLQPNRVSTPFVETEVIPNSDADVSDAEFEVETVGDNADDNIQAKADAGTPEMSLEDYEEEGAVGTTDNDTVPQGKASPKAAPDDPISPEMTSSDEAEPETKKFITEDVVLTPSPALALEEYQEEVFEEEDASSALPVSDENRDLFIEALNSDTPAIAAAVSDAVQHQGKKPMIQGSVFRALSASRAVGFEYSPSTDQLVRLMSEGAGEDTEPEALLRFAAAIRTAVFVPEANLRPVIANLNLGSFGPELSDLQTTVTDLPYTFPPAQEDLADLAGAPKKAKRNRILRNLEKWVQETSQCQGVCQPSSRYLHTLVKPAGTVGSAVAAMKDGAANAAEKALEAVEQIEGHDAIEAGYRSLFTPRGSRNATKLTTKSMDYVIRRTDEAADMLRAWAEAGERAHRKTDVLAQQTLDQLRGQMVRAQAKLGNRVARNEAKKDAALDVAIAGAILEAIKNAISGLGGQDPDEESRPRSTSDAMHADLNRLPPDTRRAAASGDHATLLKSLQDTGIPDIQTAFDLNLEACAFDTACQITRWLPDAQDELRETLVAAQSAFILDYSQKIRALARGLNTAARHDFHNQERYPALVNWCEELQQTLKDAAQDKSVFQDFDGHLARVRQAKKTLAEAEEQIRAEQRSRVEDLRRHANPGDADIVLRHIEDRSGFEAIENRIARLRDGRSVADFEDPIEEEDLMVGFAPHFIEAANKDGWPTTAIDYATAFSSPSGPLAAAEDRAEIAAELMAAFESVRHDVMRAQLCGKTLVQLLEGLGFESVKVSSEARLGSAKAWRYEMRTRVRHDGWFLPPVFGKSARDIYRLIVCESKVLPEVLTVALDPHYPTYLLVTGRLSVAQRHGFAKHLRKSRIPTVVIDETLSAYAAKRKDLRLQTIFTCGLPYGRVEPYDTNAGALPEEMFFGRKEEIERIMSTDYEGCLVHGGRQLGKSALLAHIEKLFHDPEAGRIVVRDQVTNLGLQDEPALQVWTRIYNLLSPYEAVVRKDSKDDSDAICRDIANWLSQTSARRRVIVLLDEADEFISAESTSGFPEITRLKELMEKTGREFKVVFAGLHNVQRLHNVANSPLPHLRTPTVIGPLNRTRGDRQAGYELVTEPLRAAGFRFESPQDADRILAYTNEYPSLVQEFMSGLISQRHKMLGKSYAMPEDGPLWVIPHQELFEHDGFADIESKIREKFLLTLNLDVRYALVAYTLAHIAQHDKQRALLDGLLPRTILEEALLYWPTSIDRLDLTAFEVILDEMVDLGVLGKVDSSSSLQKSYCLRSPEVIPMLGTADDIEEELLRLPEREPKPRYDRATNRRLVPATTPDEPKKDYLPLTDLQIERLLDRGTHGPKIICGLRMLQLDQIGTFMERVNRAGGMPGVNPEQPIKIYAVDRIDAFRKAFEAKPVSSGMLKVVFYRHTGTAADAEKVMRLAADATRVKRGQVRPIIILDAGQKENRDFATRPLYSSEFLFPWGPDALRMHLRQIEATDLDLPEIRDRILAVTGGIPSHVVETVSQLRNASDRMGLLDRLDLPIHNDHLPDMPDLAQVLDWLSDYNNDHASKEQLDGLNEMLSDGVGQDLVSLGPDLQAIGLLKEGYKEHYQIELTSLGIYLKHHIPDAAQELS